MKSCQIFLFPAAVSKNIHHVTQPNCSRMFIQCNRSRETNNMVIHKGSSVLGAVRDLQLSCHFGHSRYNVLPYQAASNFSSFLSNVNYNLLNDC